MKSIFILTSLFYSNIASAFCLLQVSVCELQTNNFRTQNRILESYNGITTSVRDYSAVSTFGYTLKSHHGTQVVVIPVWSPIWSINLTDAQSSSLLECYDKRTVLMNSVPICTQ